MNIISLFDVFSNSMSDELHKSFTVRLKQSAILIRESIATTFLLFRESLSVVGATPIFFCKLPD